MRLSQFDMVLQILGLDILPKHELDTEEGKSSWTLAPCSKEVGTPGKNANGVFVTCFHVQWDDLSIHVLNSTGN